MNNIHQCQQKTGIALVSLTTFHAPTQIIKNLWFTTIQTMAQELLLPSILSKRQDIISRSLCLQPCSFFVHSEPVFCLYDSPILDGCDETHIVSQPADECESAQVDDTTANPKDDHPDEQIKKSTNIPNNHLNL